MWSLIISLIIIGLILLAVELIIIPGFGIAGIGGVASIIISCYLAFSSYGPTAGIIVVISSIILTIISTLLILRSKTWKKASLSTSIDSKTDSAPLEKGLKIGDRGLTLTRLAPGGHIKVNQIVTEAFTHNEIIDSQKRVEIIQIEENKIFVKEVIGNE